MVCISGGGGVSDVRKCVCCSLELEQFRAEHNRSGEGGVSVPGNYVCSCNSLGHNTTGLCAGGAGLQTILTMCATVTVNNTTQHVSVQVLRTET